MTRTVILLCLLLTHVAIKAQTPNRPGWGVLARGSAAIVVGTVEEDFWVIRPEKMLPPTQTPSNGRHVVELADPSEFTAGQLIRLHIREIVKGTRRIKADATIDIYIPGQLGSEGSPSFAAKQTYLLFLSPLRIQDSSFSGLVLYQPSAPSNQQIPFNARSSYTVVEGANGAIQLTGNNRGLVAEVKRALRDSRE